MFCLIAWLSEILSNLQDTVLRTDRLIYFKSFQISFKGKNYRRQLTTATLAARSAAQMPLQVRTVLNHKQFSLGTGKRLLFALISTFLPPWSSNFIKFYYNSRFILHNHHILHSSVLFPQFRDIRSFPNFLSTRNRNKRNIQIFFLSADSIIRIWLCSTLPRDYWW